MPSESARWTTSGTPLAEPRLLEIDGTNRPDHYRLAEGDTCYFLFEYTAGKGYGFSETNQLISNLKKKPSQSGKNGYHYKARAITRAGKDLAQALNPKWIANGTVVPVPSSKAPGHPDYDDRLTRIAKLIPGADVRELVRNTKSHEAAHESDHRPTVEDLVEIYEIDESLADPEPTSIVIFDDVLTAGTHFKAMQQVLRGRFPNAKIYGVFIARRALPKAADEFDDIDPDWDF